MKLRNKTNALVVACAFFFANGCNRDDEITAYQAPKENAAASAGLDPVAMASDEAPQEATGVSAPIHWSVPAGWKQLAGSEMRFATLQVGDGNPKLELSVIPLGPEAGQLLPNLNRWEQQLGLAQSSETDAPKRLTPVKLADSEANLVDLSNTQQRMLAAIIPHENRTWFFKLVGPAVVVSAQKEKFDSFIKSVHFGNVGNIAPADAAAPVTQQPAAIAQPPLPAGHPPLPGAQPSLPAGHPALPGDGAQAAPAAQAAPGAISMDASWKTPNDWTEEPPKQMRALSYFVNSGNQTGEIIVTRMDANHFGALLDNLNRWRGQIGLEPVADDSSIKPGKVKIGSSEAPLYDFVGPKAGDQPARRILVTMIINGPDVWFFKFVGSSDLVSSEKNVFELFLSSVRFQASAQQ